MPVLLQIDSVPRNNNPFGSQSQPLLQPALPSEPNPPACAHHTMPRNVFPRPQRPNHLPRRSGMSAGRRDFAVRGNAALRNTPNLRQHVRKHSRIQCASGIRIGIPTAIIADTCLCRNGGRYFSLTWDRIDPNINFDDRSGCLPPLT